MRKCWYTSGVDVDISETQRNYTAKAISDSTKINSEPTGEKKSIDQGDAPTYDAPPVSSKISADGSIDRIDACSHAPSVTSALKISEVYHHATFTSTWTTCAETGFQVTFSKNSIKTTFSKNSIKDN
jgi:hypothetical protein